MMPIALLRSTVVAYVLVMSGCALDPASAAGGGATGKPSAEYTLVLARGQQAVVPAETLTVRLTEINDSRCPAKVACIWAGHASIILQVSKPGIPAGSVTLGTEPPPGMALPGDGSYGGYHFHLVELDAGDAADVAASTPAPRATLTISRP